MCQSDMTKIAKSSAIFFSQDLVLVKISRPWLVNKHIRKLGEVGHII